MKFFGVNSFPDTWLSIVPFHFVGCPSTLLRISHSEKSFLSFLLLPRASYIPSWPEIYCVTKDNHEFLILLPIPLSVEIIGYYVSPSLVLYGTMDQTPGFGNAK